MVVFVFEHGSVKGAIATLEFERMARERRLDVKILSRGVNPNAEIPVLAARGSKSRWL